MFTSLKSVADVDINFLGHDANKACSRCLKSFPKVDNNLLDCSGYERDSWPVRTDVIHRQNAYKTLMAKTKGHQ